MSTVDTTLVPQLHTRAQECIILGSIPEQIQFNYSDERQKQAKQSFPIWKRLKMSLVTIVLGV